MRALVFLLLVGAAHADRGIYPELSGPVEAELAASAVPGGTLLRVDTKHATATLYGGDQPLKTYSYPLDQATQREVGDVPRRNEGAAPDHDDDGIVDRLDIVRGMKKLLLNRAAYHEAYRRLGYPGGDVPRTEGVCTDTIVRALRNAGIDLQRAVHDDIVAARAAYPMVDRVDANINHRRVKTLLVWFRRHARNVAASRDYQPGDVVFLDTFPSRPGAEHVGLVSDRMQDGRPLIINNWTDGAVDAEMPLLGAVAVTDHFRME